MRFPTPPAPFGAPTVMEDANVLIFDPKKEIFEPGSKTLG
jgi:hypothetical protein